MLVIRRSTNWLGLIKLFIGFVLVMGVFYTYHQVVARADGIDWISADPTVRIRTDLPDPSGGGCTNQDVYIGSFSITATKDTICVYKADGFSYGVLNKSVQVGCCSSYQDTNFVVSFPGDTHMYRVTGVPTVNITHIPNSKHLVFRTYMGGSYRHHLNIIKDFRSKLRRVTDGLTISYELKEGATEPLLKDENNTPIYVHEVGFSSNGEWLAAEIRSGGLIRFNMKDFTFKRFSNYQPVYGLGQDGHIEFAISDDGRYVAFGGMNIDFRISDLNGDCGVVQSMINSTLSTLVDNPCPERSLHSIVDATTPDLRWVSYPRFDPYGGELTVYTAHYDRVGVINTPRWVTITAHDYNTAPRLDYLALGDSYSSGEGDTEVDTFGHKYYRGWTDSEENYSQGIPREKCHVSTRSYPYLLARSMNLAFDSPKEWDTVACSGATVWDIQEQAHDAYEGQGKRLINYDINTHKTQALNEFIPGRQKQIEFVKKYKPKVITLTVGGNDVGFADKIKKCLFFPGTCEYATDESRSLLASEIKNQFDSLKSLYNDLYIASGFSSKIYVLGYPQFIASKESASCGINIGFIDTQERQMITAGVSFLNNVIKKATEAAGVKYIDIEDSLGENKLCDNGEAYVTGVAAWGRSENQESFHPNSKGNNAIASYILHEKNSNNQSMLDYDICPSGNQGICPDSNVTKDSIQVPSYFQSSQTDLNIENKNMLSREVKKGTPVDVFLGSYTFLPNSTVTVMLHSDPFKLGQFLVNQDGSLTSTITIPSIIPAGYHTITIKGSTYSGDLIEYEQNILILGLDNSDIDEDNISDDVDKCFFLPSLSIDIDQDSMDDACDPQITTVVSRYDDNIKNTVLFRGKESTNNPSSEDNTNKQISQQPFKDKDIQTSKEVNGVLPNTSITLIDSKTLIIYIVIAVTLCMSVAIILISKWKVK